MQKFIIHPPAGRLAAPIGSPTAGRAQKTTSKAVSKREPPILSQYEFNRQHRALAARLLAYQQRKYRNKVELPPAVLREMAFTARHNLHANNLAARIDFADTASKVLTPHFLAEERPIWWITLTPGQYALRFEDACAFDVSALQKWTTAVLEDINFVGMVDIGCYPVPHATRSAVVASFHVHLLAWGATAAEIATLEARINSRWTAFVPRRPVFYARHVSPDWANRVTWYALKSPLKSSRFVSKLVWIDPDGVIHERGEDRHFEATITSGRAARMCMVLHDKYLDRMLFGMKEGVPLVHKIRERALAQFEQRQRLRGDQ